VKQRKLQNPHHKDVGKHKRNFIISIEFSIAFLPTFLEAHLFLLEAALHHVVNMILQPNAHVVA
jgi:hypothetical protein